MTTDRITIGVLPWLDYVVAHPRGRIALVTTQRRRYLEPGGMAWSKYGPLVAGLRRAMNSPTPSTELDSVVNAAAARDRGDEVLYRECADGFLAAVPQGATGVKVRERTWAEGDLEVVMRSMIGLRLTDGTLWLVLPYCKGPEVDKDSADVLLCMMESVCDQMLPGGKPVVIDCRRGKMFKLHARTNRRAFDAFARGLGAGYLRHWWLAA
jgi:hypothetical protein